MKKIDQNVSHSTPHSSNRSSPSKQPEDTDIHQIVDAQLASLNTQDNNTLKVPPSDFTPKRRETKESNSTELNQGTIEPLKLEPWGIKESQVQNMLYDYLKAHE